MCAMVVDTRSWCKKRATLSHATFYHIAKVGLIVGQCETTLSHSLGGKKGLCFSYEAATGPSWTNSMTKASRKWCQETSIAPACSVWDWRLWVCIWWIVPFTCEAQAANALGQESQGCKWLLWCGRKIQKLGESARGKSTCPMWAGMWVPITITIAWFNDCDLPAVIGVQSPISPCKLGPCLLNVVL